MKTLFLRLVRDTEGQDLIEYTFLTCVLALTMIASINVLQANFTALVTVLRGILLG